MRPLPSVPQRPPGWDADKWIAHMMNEYNKRRRNMFDRIYKSAVRKKERREKEEKERIEKQRKEAEEREKEATRQRREKREKLEKEGQKYVEDLISLDFEFTDEESDDEQAESKNEVKPQDVENGNGKPEEAENGNGKPEEAENRNGKPEHAENRNGVVEKADVLIEPTDEDETDLDDKKPLGGEASDANSSVSTYSTPSRTPRSSKRLLHRSGTKNPRPMSANTVQILSNPNIIVALEQLQGIRKEQDEVQLLLNLKILTALKEVHAEMERGNFPAPEKAVVVGNEEEDMFNESVLQNIKREGKPSSKPAKHKLTEYDEFSKVWTTPKRRKKASEKEFAFSAGSLHRGEVATRDATSDKLKKMVDVKIDWIRKGDKILAGSKSTQSKNIFTQVSCCFLAFLY